MAKEIIKNPQNELEVVYSFNEQDSVKEMQKTFVSIGKINVKPLKRASVNWNLAKPRVKHRPGHRNGYRDAPVVRPWKSDVAQHDQRRRWTPIEISDGTGDKERGALRAMMDV